ncbi:CAP domain-containing protein [Shouchella lehensis]|uniref:Serine protease n=1 Tax=Shouchella lehensis G1 TaxID=1246626 RepID=A0A060M0K2_9BACI|nr:CAP-associated domain-containing protein [Shouchella lehensis]AIC95977.1 hypothetical protein BleG1_3430 [Shouchella lehensis G1]
MRRLLVCVVIVIIAYSTREFWFEPTKKALASSVDSIQEWSGDTTFDFSFEFVDDFLRAVLPVEEQAEEEAVAVEAPAPDLVTPEDTFFSVHNIELGDTKQEVEEEVGEPKRVTVNEYGLEWYAYHSDYQNFFMVSYNENDLVKGLYTNQDLLASESGITYGTPQQVVREQLGEPIDVLRKGLFSYKLNEEEAYDLFELEDSYVTMFYDEHQDLTVTGIQIMDHDVEQDKRSLYADQDEALRDGFEYQLFDVMNAERVAHDLPILVWAEDVRYTARKHSADMAEKRYFDHTNLEGKSPYDRMQEDGIRFRTAGENLAMGQFSSIYAHEGLMNSLGHREAILNAQFENVGIGVAFGEEGQPFFTEKFYTR